MAALPSVSLASPSPACPRAAAHPHPHVQAHVHASGPGLPRSLRAAAASRAAFGQRKGRPSLRVSAVAAGAATEPATGIAFPGTFTPAGLTTDLALLGTGLREKKIAIIAVKVYAAAIYLDLAAGSAALKGKSGQDFLDAVAEAPADKGIVISLARNVTTDQFVNALNEELAPKLQALGADQAALLQLGALFEGRALKKDSAVVLGWQQPSTLQVSFVDDIKAGYTSSTPPAAIDSLPLLKSLFDLYLGANPISPSLQSSIAAAAASFS